MSMSDLLNQGKLTGVYNFRCTDGENNLLWEEERANLLVTTGKNLVLDQSLAGSSYTAAEFMGLITSASFSAIVAADTMASHAGWLEGGGTNAPAYTGNRGTTAWSAASAGAKALSASLAFVFTNSGTVQGAFMVGGASAVSTKDSTAGTLISAGTLSAAQPVISGNTLSVAYTLTLT